MRPLVVLALLALAGCAAPAGDGRPDPAFPVEDGRVPAGEESLAFAPPVVVLHECGLGSPIPCFEPSVVADAPERLLASNGYAGRIARSDDAGRTWVPLLAARPLEQPLAAGGDALFQRARDGSLWHSALLQTSVQLARTDDGGVTWSPNTLARFGTPVDRNWLAFGDAGLVVVHIQGEEGVRASASRDGGATWGSPVLLTEGASIHGPGASARGGVAIPVFDYGARELVVHRSLDGATWERVVVSARTGDFFPALAGEGDTLHLAWKAGHELVLASSTDGGATWSAPAVASLPGERVAVSPWIVAREGAVAILYFVAENADAPADLRALRIDGEQVARGTLATGIASNGVKEERPGNSDHAHGDLDANGRLVAVFADAEGRLMFVGER